MHMTHCAYNTYTHVVRRYTGCLIFFPSFKTVRYMNSALLLLVCIGNSRVISSRGQICTCSFLTLLFAAIKKIIKIC